MGDQRWKTIIRDLLQLAIGAFILIHEELTGIANTVLLIIGLVLLGSPSALWLVSMFISKPPDSGQPAKNSSSSHRSSRSP
jgi:hypothetical protein